MAVQRVGRRCFRDSPVNYRVLYQSGQGSDKILTGAKSKTNWQDALISFSKLY